MSFNKVSPAQGVLRRKESETESIELDLIQSFPVGVKETIKQRRSNQLGNIKIDDTSRIIMSETPETPSTGAVGRYWKWSHLDVTRTPSNSSTTGKALQWDEHNNGERSRNISVTSSASHDSTSSNLTDINPYISLIHSDSLRRYPRGTKDYKIEKRLDHESMSITFRLSFKSDQIITMFITSI